MAATAFDPDKFLAETGGFDPDKFLADAAEPMTERQKLQAQGRQSVEKRMAAEPEYAEVPIYGPDGAATGATERVMKPRADPIGAGVLSTLPFGEDIGAIGRSMVSGRTMSQEKDIGEGVRQATQEAYPGAYRAGQVGGFLPALALPMGLAGRATGFAGKTALGALEGAGYGGAMGFGEGNTLEERLAAAKSGAIGGGVLGGALGRFAAPAEKAAAPAVPASVQAAERLGVDLPYYAVTDSPALQRATKVSESIPLAGEPVAAARQKAVTQLEDAVDALVPKMTTEQAGERIGTGIKGWMTSGVREKAKAAYDEVAGLFENASATKPLENTRGAVADIMAQRASAKLEGTTPAIDLLMPAVRSGEGLTYDGAKTLYTELRNLRSENMIKGVKDANVDKLYNALKNDVLDIAEEAGGAPARFFLQKADRQYQQMSAMREQLAKIVGKKAEAVSDEQIFNRLFNASKDGGSANNKLVQRAITVMEPEQLKAFQAGILSKLGRDAQGNFSPDRWLGAKGINALSPRAKAMIFKDEPKLVQALNDVTTISERFKNLNKFGNPSGTSQGIFGGLTITSMIHSPIKTLAAIAGANGFTRIMSKPATAQGFADWARRYENFVRFPTEQSGKLAYRAGQQLNRMVAEEAGKTVDVNDYLNKGP
ncbi:hypothetical protein UFOVP1417_44 [uncultured Caudovirales phage]|uniref:Uncharacterized protein n=1 Tax=uncultured Caudovirales phage TaxID=2100421 RepID=A0A6J5N977_9CAUD|nr:hypothetical protein UFOVP664_43 [uncultured Caudovirales phage]CAB4195379.1 hypothetical protein UFOVP1303_10 [uncultured Caudovirales phage]CAB4210805.1 hypothetical protein UFOVP1417_44 [uncultured Caudovirales phage]CAB5226910.1 hypothetical protein UFOVP1517_67 [uncultured Caudovirales phage]